MTLDELVNILTLEEKVTLLNGASTMSTAEIARLGIPAKKFADGPHGVRGEQSMNCTMFPNLCCVGATWDTSLTYQLGQALAEDCIEHNVDLLLGPGANIKRTPLCGRNFEYFSEDPVVTGEMAAAYINGLQSKGVGASLKHYAMNNQERYRLETSVEVDLRVMREIYLKGFEIAVKKAAPQSVMCSYNKVHSIWCSENRHLLTDILKTEWNYDGFVVSDWGAVRDICKALCAGLDLQMPRSNSIHKEISDGLQNGMISMEVIDAAVKTILRFALKDKPKTDKLYSRDRQHQLSRQVAADGIVLLKNRYGVLPLNSEKYKKIGVIGEYAEHPLLFGQGSAEVYASPNYIDSPLGELQKALGQNVEVVYQEVYKRRELPGKMIWTQLDQWETFAADCDAVVMFVGSMESEDTEQFDRRTLEFNPNFEYVINAISRVNKNVIVVIQSGSAMILGDWRDKVSGIVHMWFGGEGAGGAIADVLTGRVNPSGKLTETFPKVMRSDLEYPGDGLKVRYNEGFDVGYRYYDKHTDEICYPFGYGLSYSEFIYSDFKVEQNESNIDVTLTVSNRGKYDGKEVIQIYVGKNESCITRPIKELKAFQKVFVRVGESATPTISIPVQDLAYYNVLLNQWVVEPGVYEIMIASSSQDIRYSTQIQIQNDVPYTINSFAVGMVG